MAKDIMLGILAIVFTAAIFYSMLNVYPLAVLFFGLMLWGTMANLCE